jgi:hypothetical protein
LEGEVKDKVTAQITLQERRKVRIKLRTRIPLQGKGMKQ